MTVGYLSVCSGIESASVAWEPLGFEPIAFAENEPFPSAVLARHYPAVQNWGDITRFEDWPDAKFDVLVGGTPCQGFSVAGLRKGLDDPRARLVWSYLAIAERYRPEWLVWENVPGVLSLDGGRAFGAILGRMAELGYGFAYRILDAQHFGVPQRRRRVFVVGHLGDWRRAAAVLFERHGLSGDSPPRREAGEGVALPITSRVDRGGEHREAHGNNLIAGSIDASNGGVDENDDASADGTGRGTPLIADTVRSHPRPGSNSAGALAFVNTAGAAALGMSLEGVPPVTARNGDPGNVLQNRTVRRLTPAECEKLQGFPPGYTAITYRGKPAADGPRYRALGNSMAVPCMAWIGERLRS